jgi:hypothetical protein
MPEWGDRSRQGAWQALIEELTEGHIAAHIMARRPQEQLLPTASGRITGPTAIRLTVLAATAIRLMALAATAIQLMALATAIRLMVLAATTGRASAPPEEWRSIGPAGTEAQLKKSRTREGAANLQMDLFFCRRDAPPLLGSGRACGWAAGPLRYYWASQHWCLERSGDRRSSTSSWGRDVSCLHTITRNMPHVFLRRQSFLMVLRLFERPIFLPFRSCIRRMLSRTRAEEARMRGRASAATCASLSRLTDGNDSVGRLETASICRLQSDVVTPDSAILRPRADLSSRSTFTSEEDRQFSSGGKASNGKPSNNDGACISRQSQPETSNQMSQILS